MSTLSADKAPAGFGLGGQSKFISASEDLNNVVYNGWYRFDAAPINAPFLDSVNAVSYASMLVTNRIPSLYVTQEIFCYGSWEAFNCVLRRCRINGEWKPWEWENPPMMLGVEYRTTKRYRGKPIYTMSVDCKTGPTAGKDTATYISIGETVAAENVLSVKGFAEGGFTLPPGSNYTPAGVYIVAKPSVGINPKNQITVCVASAVDYSSQHIYAVIEYTKTA